ncbi:MAG: polysaccharide biosynthesis C-terminal domain-containing protein [Oscillospiraceae bacterium]|nr:polysaccharide biosynthesis C-terminal domain-containing protein [Oscillospiraceae bacterium]
MKRQSFLRGSLLLTLSALAAKVLGALFKLPLTAMLGGTGLGYFSSAYGLFLPLYAVLVTGMSTAVARPVAQYAALGRPGACACIRRTARRSFLLLGLIGSLLTCVLASPFLHHTGASPEALPAVLAIAPAVLVCCLTAVERGYYEGLCSMTPTALSQAVEAALRCVLGLLLCRFCMAHPPLPALSPAANGAFGAVCGVTLGALGSLVYLWGCSLRTRHRPDGSLPPRRILRLLFGLMLPVSVGALVTNLTSLIDLVTVMRCFSGQLMQDPERFYAAARIAPEIPPEEAASFAYGSYMGLSVTVFNLVPSLTGSLGKSALPCAAQCFCRGDREGTAFHARQVLLLAALAAVPAGCGIAVLGEETLAFLFAGRIGEIRAAAGSLVCLAPGMVCLCLSSGIFSILQAAGRADLPVKLLVPGAAVKLVLNLLLLPRYGTAGAGLATSAGYVLILALSLVCLRRVLGVPLHLGRPLVCMLYSGVMCAAAAWLSCRCLQGRLPFHAGYLLAVCAGAGVYVLCMLLCAGRELSRLKSPAVQA